MSDDDQRLLHQRAQEAQEIFDAIAPMLAGRAPDIQGATIAMLFGAFLAGHKSTGGEEGTASFREKICRITVDNAFKHMRAIDEAEGKPKETRQ